MSRHPTPPLPFHLFSSSSLAQTMFPKPHPATLPRDDLATSGGWSTGPGPSEEGGAKGVGEAFGVFQPPCTSSQSRRLASLAGQSWVAKGGLSLGG